MRCPRCSNGVMLRDPYGDAPQCFTCGYYHVISVDITQRASREVLMSGHYSSAPIDPYDWEE